ncbi:glycosyltransferase family 92 protein F13G3.3-like [Ruditapes philippinarum]|uniref:glycosyltransferase family 92 protein F13G3.3-like n=1 Tax=Ruditapes philippinarum TaxID=129788 RepID=UPI00295C061E|nr:glycosyltransferase family 92 protein F13G3.3-like [Ruditapes philippinarum]
MFIICNMTGKVAPDTVSFYDRNSARHLPHAIKVVKITQHTHQHKFIACVSPLHSMFSDSTQLIEWIELNRLLGIEKFIFYIHHISQKVLQVLEYYERNGLLSLLPWNIPKYMAYHGSEVHYYGQLAALNDCLYRYKGRSVFISSTDLDEFIIPQKLNHRTLSDMISELPANSAYIVRSSFFRKNQACTKHGSCKNGITIDTFNLRDNIILPTHKRSKYIAKTSELTVMGIHFTWELHTGSEYTVKPEMALVHHYRKINTRYTTKEPMKIIHTVASKYSANLKRNIKNVTVEIFYNSTGHG